MKRIYAAVVLLVALGARADNPGTLRTQGVPNGYPFATNVLPTTATSTLAALNATVTISVDGQAGAGLVIPASSTLVSTLTPYFSCDNGTTFTASSFLDTSGNATSTLTTATATAYQFAVATIPCARQVQVKVTSFTSGTVSATLVATQQAALGSATQGFGTAGSPSGGVFTVQPPSSGSTTFPVAGATSSNTALGTGAAVFPAAARTASPAYTAGNVGPVSMDVAGAVNTVLGDPGTTVQVAATNASAAGNGLYVLPGVARAGVTAATAGRSTALAVDTVSGGALNTPIPTSNNAALTTAAVSVNSATSVKASTGNVYGVACVNANASICYLQFYNIATAPTCGTSVVWSLPLPTSSQPPLVIINDIPMANHATGIGVCMGTTPTGNTACATANSCTIFYK